MDKNKFNVLIVATNFIEKWNKLELSCKENLSINAISAYLEMKGYNVTTINAQFENWDNKEILKKIENIRFDYIGVSCSPQKLYVSSKEFIKLARKRYPEACIVMGGIFPSLSYMDILKDIPELDYVSTGEGEFALEMLCQYVKTGNIDLSEIPGLAYRKEGGIVRNKTERITELDFLPFPKRDIRTFENVKGNYANVMAGRGCYGNCSFCSIHSAFDYRKRICRSPKNLVAEINMLVNKFHVKYIQFHDDIFYDYSLKSQKWLKEFVDEVKKSNVVFKFRIYLRPNDVKEKELLILKEIGLDSVFIGVESGVQRVLDEMNKAITIKQAENAIKIIRKVGLHLHLGFITIIPTMTFEELKENYEFIYKVKSDNDANLHNRLNIYNGCKYEGILRSLNLLNDKENFWDIHTYKFADKRVERYHDCLQYLKEIGSSLKHTANKMISELGYEYEKQINSKVYEVWEQATKELLYYVEKSDLDKEINKDIIYALGIKFKIAEKNFKCLACK